MDDMKDFYQRVFRLLARDMNVDDLTVAKEDVAEAEPEAAEGARGAALTCVSGGGWGWGVWTCSFCCLCLLCGPRLPLPGS